MKPTSLTRRERPGRLGRLYEPMDLLFERLLEDWPWAPQRDWEWYPPVDIAEEDDRVVVTAELPGLDAKDIGITVVGNTLRIAGQKREEAEEKREGYYRSERRFGSFRREITLPADVDPDKVEANNRDGVLTVTMPKVEAAKPRQIPIHK